MFKLLLLILSFTLQHAILSAQTLHPEDELSLSETTAHLRFLASDELMGRKTGTTGNDIAARYIAEQFRAAGLSEVAGAKDYLFRIAFEDITPPQAGSLSLQGEVLQQSDDFVIVDGEAGTFSGAAISKKYGRSQPYYSQDDYGGEAVAGKIVVVKLGTPETTGQEAFLESRKKRWIAAKKGAVGLIELYSGPIPWMGLSRFLMRSRIQISESPADRSHRRIFHLILNDGDGKYAQHFENHEGLSLTLESGPFYRREATSSNIVGMVTGRDPQLKNEFIVLSAHFDHVGAGLDLPGATPADSIFNGAGDNATGTVALMSAAKALAQKPPARSVLFVAMTAEEEGLLGSRYYVENPLIPLSQTVFVLNTDGGGMSDPDVVTILGFERTTAAATITKACQEQSLQAITDPVPQLRLFNHSDNLPFAQAGVPAITFSPGFKAFDEKMTSRLHQPGDEADENFDFHYLLNFCKAYTRTARMIADLPERPRWSAGDEFEKPARELY